MTGYKDLQKAAEYAAQDTIKFADENEEMRALQQFHEEVDPETVLALIAENDRLLELLERTVDQHVPLTELEGVPGWSRVVELVEVVAERDQLKAENEALRKRIDDMSPFKGAPLTGQDTKCLACGGYHYGMGGLPCPNMRVTAQTDLPETRSGQIGGAMGKGERS